MKRAQCLVLICIVLMAEATGGQQFTHRLNNQDVIDMISSGVSDDVIIEKIQSTASTDFDTTPVGLRTLKASRVADAVMKAMINPHRATSTVPVASGSAFLPTSNVLEEVGVYLLRNGVWEQLEPEIVGRREGGVLKRYATLGLDREHVNGTVMLPNSSVSFAMPGEFLVKTLEGTSATEYQLLHLYQRGDRREFRAVTGGVYHASSGAERNLIRFRPEKVAPRTWRIRVTDLSVGEYGFLPPGVMSDSLAASGKIYSFAVVREEARNVVTKGAPEVSNGNDSHSAQDVLGASSLLPTIGASSDENPQVRHDGVTISHVVPNGPCDKAGIGVGDVLLAIDDHFVFTVEEMNNQVRRYRVGVKVSIRYRRRSTIYDVPVLLVASP